MDMIISIVRNTDNPRQTPDDISDCEIHVLKASLAREDLATYFATYDKKIDMLFDYCTD